jgi:hypothetical protein
MAPLARFANVTQGYPQLAALISKENGFAVFRKFSALGAHNILYLQAKLTNLEQQLEQIDRELLTTNEQSLKSWQCFSSDKQRARLIGKIRKTLHEYCMERGTCCLNRAQVEQ